MGYSNIKNIVVRMPNWLGDIIMATPVLEDLRERFPEANIVAMCQSNGAAILEGNPFIDEIFAYQRPKTNSEKTAIIEKIRDGNYDLGVLTTNSFSSAWWFLRGKVKQRIGYTGNLRGFLLTTAIPFPKERECQHLVDTYKNILTPLGTKISKSTTQCYVSDEERRHANITLEDLGVPTDATIIGINASAAFGTAKCWLPERFAGLTQRLLEDINVHVLYFGDASGTSLIEGICSNFTERVYSMAGKTSLRSFISLVAACNVFITNDSGPMHIAAALKTPLVAIFGSTNDTTTGPYQWGTVIHNRVSCSPCYKRECPTDFRCMRSISVEDVYRETKKVLHNEDRLSRLDEQKKLLLEDKPETPKVTPYGKCDVVDMSIRNSDAVAAGTVGCVIIAGGEGTRLGVQGPKGAFPTSVIENKSLFQMFAEKVVAAGKQGDRNLPLAIMTSSKNHDATVSFFEEHNFFGLNSDDVSFFKQGTLPYLDDEGNVFFEEKDVIAEGPDGNGTTLKNFYDSGLWRQWYDNGIRYLNIVLVDNPLAMPYDPRLVEYHINKGGDVTVQCIEKKEPQEKLGVMARNGDDTVVVEYTELSEDEKTATNTSGELLYGLGHIGIYCLNMDFVEKVATHKTPMPLHLAYKNVKKIDGDTMAWKFEAFIFDILQYAENVNVVLYPRDKCFAPLKNKDGDDSIKTVHEALQHYDSAAFKELFGRETTVPTELSQEFHYPTQRLIDACRESDVAGGYIEERSIISREK